MDCHNHQNYNNDRVSFTLKKCSNYEYLISCQSHFLMRNWMSQGSLDFKANQFVLPIFVINDDEKIEIIKSMPNVNRFGVQKVLEFVQPLIEKFSLGSVLLFPVVSEKGIDKATDLRFNPVLRLVPILKKKFPHLYIITDVCLCAFSHDGHCAVYNDLGKIDLELTLKHLANISLAYANAGANMIAPSDMTDTRVAAIRNILNSNHCRDVSIMSYSAKFASCMYNPFRDAAQSAPKVGDRKCYQITPGSAGLAMRAVERDIREGADIVMVKPGLFYLDILSKIKSNYPNVPIAVYNTSGEYAMICKASSEDILDLKTAVFEMITAFKRAGAQIIITYFTPFILEWLKNDK